MQRKIEAGASFAITQLGYDIDKYEELLQYNRDKNIDTPVLASLYLLDKRSARAMHAGRVPGVHVTDRLCKTVLREWEQHGGGMPQAIERTAGLGVVLKGIGYKGIHLGGIHGSFEDVG
jgi:methylenetetrahydrofolate reductase (NADPH)